MKTIKLTAIALFLAVALGACSSKMSFTSSSVVPAATGDVKVKDNKNNNYDIDVSVTNLAEPQQLSPSREVYIVWMETERNSVEKLGQMVISSRALKGSLSTTSSFEPRKVFITAENDAQVLNPIGQTVLTTR